MMERVGSGPVLAWTGLDNIEELGRSRDWAFLDVLLGPGLLEGHNRGM